MFFVAFRCLALGAALLISGLSSTPTFAAKRVALVIGNSAYKIAGELPNPRNDAADISAIFKGLGFQVVEGIDLDKAAFDRKIRDFATALQGAELGVSFTPGTACRLEGKITSFQPMRNCLRKMGWTSRWSGLTSCTARWSAPPTLT
jgi:hypothetical protein